MRIVGWTVVAAIALFVPAAPSGAAAGSAPHAAAVDVYVEEFPTSSGSVRADASAVTGRAYYTTGASGSDVGGLVGLGLVLAGVTTLIVVVRMRRERQRS